MPPAAVLFDFDGVIADTENVHVAAWERTLRELGWELPTEVSALAAEIDDRSFLAEIFERRGIEGGDLRGWVARKQALTRAMLTDSPRVYRGVAEVIDRLRVRTRLAIVSTTWRENVEVILHATGLADTFEVIVGKEDVSEAKPHPEGYRLALKRLGLTAGEAIALEDSATGLAAARLAGVPCVLVGHRLPRGDWIGSSPYLSDLVNVGEVLASLGFSG